jgi:hypothetical protein
MEAEAARHRRNRRNFKASGSEEQIVDLLKYPPKEVVTRNYLAPVMAAADMDTDASGADATSDEDAVPGKTDRPPPIIITTTTNLIQLQTQLKSMIKGNIEFRSTRNGTRVITRVLADFQSVKSHFDASNLSYYLFCLKSEKKLFKAVIRKLPYNAPAEGISGGPRV